MLIGRQIVLANRQPRWARWGLWKDGYQPGDIARPEAADIPPIEEYNAAPRRKQPGHRPEPIFGRATLVIAHRLSTIRSADRIVVLEEARVVEAGAHDELLPHGRVYSSLIAAQTEAAQRVSSE